MVLTREIERKRRESRGGTVPHLANYFRMNKSTITADTFLKLLLTQPDQRNQFYEPSLYFLSFSFTFTLSQVLVDLAGTSKENPPPTV